MKSKEIKLLDKLRDKVNLTICGEEFSPFDAFNTNYIAELKVRDKAYNEKALEVCKCYQLLQLASKYNKSALYIVEDSAGIFVFNLSKHAKEIIKQRIEVVPMPTTTEGVDKVTIDKYLYLLNSEMSTIINN